MQPDVNAISSVPAGYSADEAFRLWSRTYDDELNPLLCVEDRFLRCLLPSVRGLRVLDVGCGTGRWLQALASQKPKELVGVDSSPAMLSRARSKCGTNCLLHVGEARALPGQDSSFDLVLALFVVSYVDKLEEFVAELARVTRDGGCVYISDLHPDTAGACGWKRAFRTGAVTVELNSHQRSIENVVACFEDHGFSVESMIEPMFGAPERMILQAAGKLDALEQTANRPAIYILRLRRRGVTACRESVGELLLQRARMSLGADETIEASVAISGGRIESIGVRSGSRVQRSLREVIDLSGYLVLPGLINSHDHLEFGLFPSLGYGPYTSYKQWANDIHRRHAAEIDLHSRVPKDVRVWFGAIRNLLCGVTTVCHHNPITPIMKGVDFPVRVVTDFGWAHSVGMEAEWASRFHETAPEEPFIVHVGEGFDAECENELRELDRVGALNDRAVLVHGLALTGDDARLLKSREAAIVWCPTSNCFLFKRTHTPEFIASVGTIVLGSDSPLTAKGDLLDELRFACSEVEIPPHELYQQVTRRAAEVLRLHDGQGTLTPRARADLIAVRDTGKTPADTLSLLSYADVELVLLGGRVQLASESMMARLPAELTSDLRPLQVESSIVRWIRAPLGRLFGAAESVLGCTLTLGGKRIRNLTTEWL